MTPSQNSTKCAVGPWHSFRFKRVLRYDRKSKMLRAARVVWQRGKVGDGTGYSTKLSLALHPRLFSFHRDWSETIIVIAGIRIHHQRSWGGIQV